MGPFGLKGVVGRHEHVEEGSEVLLFDDYYRDTTFITLSNLLCGKGATRIYSKVQRIGPD